MRNSHNRVDVDKLTQKNIRSMFFLQKEMKDIELETNITERIIRRIINENAWISKRERYFRYLASYAYRHDISLEKISEMTGVKYYALCRIHKKYNIPKPKKIAWNDRRSDSLEQNIVSDYQSGLTGQEIADKYGYKKKESVYQILDKNTINRKPSQKYTYYNEEFFEKINSHEKAYILGLIITDGYILKDYVGFGIQLTKEDEYILEKIRDLVGGRNPITQIDCSHKRKILHGSKDMVRLHVFSKKIAEDLKKLGVVKRKTKILRYNGCVPNKYLSSFFRGLVDGDGTVGVDKRGYYWTSIASASKEFLEDIQCNVFRWKINTSKCKNGNLIHVLKVQGGQKEIFRFYSWLYKNKNDLYLRRKYAKVQDKIS